jgi:hypothetical protein
MHKEPTMSAKSILGSFAAAVVVTSVASALAGCGAAPDQQPSGGATEGADPQAVHVAPQLAPPDTLQPPEAAILAHAADVSRGGMIQAAPSGHSVEMPIGGWGSTCNGGTTGAENSCSSSLRAAAGALGGACHTPGDPSSSGSMKYSLSGSSAWNALTCPSGTLNYVNTNNQSWEYGSFYTFHTGHWVWVNGYIGIWSPDDYSDGCGYGSAGFYLSNGSQLVWQGCQGTDYWYGWAYASPCEIAPASAYAGGGSMLFCVPGPGAGEEDDRFDPTCPGGCAW